MELPQYGFEKAERVCDMCFKSQSDAIPSILYWMSTKAEEDRLTGDGSSTILEPHDEARHTANFLEQVRREEFTSADAPNSRVVEYWNLLVSDPKHMNELRGRVLVGVPNYVRGFVWKQLSEASLCISKNPGLYASLRSKPNPNFDEMIGNDVHRTFPMNPLFDDDAHGQQALFGILRAYCHMNNDYSQCMSYIAAVLLMHMSEEDAFFVFVQMMKKYGLETIFHRDLPACLRNYSQFIEVSRPNLFNHLTNEKLSVEIFVSGWLQTLFAQQFDIGLVFRLWDVFFAHGFLFFIKVSLVLLEHAEPALLKLGNTEIIFSLKSLPMRIQDFDRLIEEAMLMEIPDSILDANTEEERLLTIMPTINYEAPPPMTTHTNPRLTLSNSAEVSASPVASPSGTPIYRRSAPPSSDSAPSTDLIYNTPQTPPRITRGSGHMPSSSSSSSRTSLPPLSASPSSRIQLM
jgi:hypothetical protein